MRAAQVYLEGYPLTNIGNVRLILEAQWTPLQCSKIAARLLVVPQQSSTGPSEPLLLCAWCGRLIRKGEAPARHGICPACVSGQGLTQPLTVVPAEVFEGLPFGVIRLTGDGIVEAYNDTEARLARRAAASVIGRHFFNEVAPCTNVQAFAGRLALMRARAVPATERFSFVFRLPWTSSVVQLALTYDPSTDRAVAIVDWSPGKGATV